ncbi:MAG: methyltransferase domain-containing protein [Symploca sp. SIO2G7]|nr:methyltransferase domain-containing protein [Symploca sp. SIO2G7]
MTVQPFLHITPHEVLAETAEQLVSIPLKGGDLQQIRLIIPTSIDVLLDHPATHKAFVQDEYMPYWAELWPAALMLGQAIAKQTWPPDRQVLEVGCGLGLSGLVALALGMKVVFSDYDVSALNFSARNARLNGFDRFRLLPLDWRCPPENLKVDLMLAADVIYEARNIEPLVQLMTAVMRPRGECWLCDPDRPHRSMFQTALTTQGFEFATQPITLERPHQPTVQGTIYRIRYPDKCTD